MCACRVCHQPLALGEVGYGPGSETWAPPGRPPLSDDDGHPLTWGRIRYGHSVLVQHTACRAGGTSRGYDSDEGGDEAVCPCLWHGQLIEELASHALCCARWPGDICGACWASS